MIPSLLVAAAISAPAAPVPKSASPNATGPAPRVVAVKSDVNGTVWISAQIWEIRKVTQQFAAVENGKQVIKQKVIEQPFSTYVHKAIGEFGARFRTAEGTSLSSEEATRRVKDGATLLIAADGKPVDRTWLRAINGDTVVMEVEGLANAHFQYAQMDIANSCLPTTASPRLALFRADEAGDVKVPVNPHTGVAQNGNLYYEDLGGGRIMRGRAVVWQGNLEIGGDGLIPQVNGNSIANHQKLLSQVKFDAFDTKGKLIPRSEAMKRLKAGGLVLLAGDNQFPDPAYLKAFRDETLVLVSGEFVFPQGMANPYDMPVTPAGTPPGARGGDAVIRPVPGIGLVAPAVRFKVAPLVVREVPAAPAPAPKR
jgi:hypothetical protein